MLSMILYKYRDKQRSDKMNSLDKKVWLNRLDRAENELSELLSGGGDHVRISERNWISRDIAKAWLASDIAHELEKIEHCQAKLEI